MSDEKFTSENMKVKHVLMIAVVLLAMLVVPVTAEGTSTTTNEKTQNVDIGTTIPVVYEISIPTGGFDFGTATSITKNIGVIITMLEPSTHIDLTVVSQNVWNLTNMKNKEYMIKYNMTVDSKELQNGNSVVISSNVGEFTKQVTFNLIGKATMAGEYKDTLTFTAKVGSGTGVNSGDELQDAINNGDGNIILGGDIDLGDGGIVIPGN